MILSAGIVVPSNSILTIVPSGNFSTWSRIATRRHSCQSEQHAGAGEHSSPRHSDALSRRGRALTHGRRAASCARSPRGWLARRRRFSTSRDLPWYRLSRAFITCHERSSLNRTDREPSGRPPLSERSRSQEHADDRRSSVRITLRPVQGVRVTFRTGRSSESAEQAFYRTREKANPRRDLMGLSLLAGTAIPGRGAVGPMCRV